MDESSGGGRWWLRSPGNNDNNAANVDGSGWVNDNGNNVNNDNVGIRPASSGCQVCILSRSICDNTLCFYLASDKGTVFLLESCFGDRVNTVWLAVITYVLSIYLIIASGDILRQPFL